MANIPALASDNPALVGCSIQAQPSDVTSVTRWQVITFQLVECSQNASSWTVPGHSFTSNGNSITVFFNGTGQPVITALNASGGEITHRGLSMASANPLAPGDITSGKSQIINYNWASAVITCQSPLNDAGSLSYMWYSSTTTTDDSSFSPTGVTSASLPARNLTTKTYFKRAVQTPDANDEDNHGFYQTEYSDIATVDVYPQLFSGTASSAQTINYNTAPAQLSVTAATGGKPGDHTYTWQYSSSSGGPFTSTGSTGSTYNPPALTSSTYYRVETNSNGAIVYSNVILITVYPDIQAGTISPATKSINYDTSPGTLTLSGVSGGTGSGYTYQWQSSTDNLTFTNVSGETGATYSVGSLTAANNWFLVLVTNNGYSKASASSHIIVYPVLSVGPITGGGITIPKNTATNGLFDDDVEGGSGTYAYTWYWSYDSINWHGSNVHAPGYPKEVLSHKKYYQLRVTSNGVTAKSPVTLISVGDPVAPCCAALKAGVITTAMRTIEGTMWADSIKATDPSGGSGTYTYSWEKSTDGANFQSTSVTTKYYPPKIPDASIYLRRTVSDGVNVASTCAIRLIVENLLANNNYIRTRTITIPDIITIEGANAITQPESVNQVTQYYDGLGRPIQSVTRQGSPQKKDLVTLQVYDQYGRESYHYLPYASTSSNNGSFQPHPIGNLTTFNEGLFPSDTVFYGTTFYEHSPLNRPVKARAPGNSWVNHGTSRSYLLNTAADSVLQWDVDTTGTILGPSTYAYGKLMKTTSTDEQLHQVVEFKDMDGHVILKKVQADPSPISSLKGWACTYYVYDDSNNLVAVFPPEAVKLFIK